MDDLRIGNTLFHDIFWRDDPHNFWMLMDTLELLESFYTAFALLHFVDLIAQHHAGGVQELLIVLMFVPVIVSSYYLLPKHVKDYSRVVAIGYAEASIIADTNEIGAEIKKVRKLVRRALDKQGIGKNDMETFFFRQEAKEVREARTACGYLKHYTRAFVWCLCRGVKDLVLGNCFTDFDFLCCKIGDAKSSAIRADGEITRKGFKKLLREELGLGARVSSRRLRLLMWRMDADESGTIDVYEFVAYIFSEEDVIELVHERLMQELQVGQFFGMKRSGRDCACRFCDDDHIRNAKARAGAIEKPPGYEALDDVQKAHFDARDIEFFKLDTGGDGSIQRHEMKTYLDEHCNIRLKDRTLDRLIHQMALGCSWLGKARDVAGKKNPHIGECKHAHASDFFDAGGAGEAGLVHISRQTFHDLLEPDCWPMPPKEGDGGAPATDSNGDSGGKGKVLAPGAEHPDSGEGGDGGAAAAVDDVGVEMVAKASFISQVQVRDEQ